MANYGAERKNYSKFTAQIIKNTVRKKLLEIRSRGARAADELIDELIERHQKSSRSPKNSKKSFLGDKAASIIGENRVKWRNFMVELSGWFDAENLSVLGVNLIYGGIMTSSAGSSGWASVVSAEASGKRDLSEIISEGRSRGNLAWIIRGSEAFSPETIKICRCFPECAFILADGAGKSLPALSGTKNILVLLKNGDQRNEKELIRQGIPYIFADGGDPIFDPKGKGREASLSSLTPSLTAFLESPRLPIVIESFSELLNTVENILSEGKSRSVPYYFT